MRPGRLASLAVALVLAGCSGEVVDIVPKDSVELAYDESRNEVSSSFFTDSCGEPDHVEVVETEDAVLVRTFIRRPRRQACEDIGIPQRLTHRLDAPLGERRLLAVE